MCGGSLSKSKDRVGLLPHIASLRKLHPAGLCGGSLSKSKDQTRLPPCTTSLQMLHPAGMCGGYLSMSKDRAGLPLRTTSLQELYFAGICEGSLSKSKDRAGLPPCIASLKKPHPTGMCGGSLSKSKDRAGLPPRTTSLQELHFAACAEALSQSLKTEPARVVSLQDLQRTGRCKGFLFRSKDRVRSPPRTTNLQLLEPTEITLAHSKHQRESSFKETTYAPKQNKTKYR